MSQTAIIPRLEPVEVVTPMTMIDKALDKALGYARSHEARFMPGWCGVDPDLAHHV